MIIFKGKNKKKPSIKNRPQGLSQYHSGTKYTYKYLKNFIRTHINNNNGHFDRTRVRSLAMLVTHWLTDSWLVNLIDVTLVCKDANSKFVDVV